MANPIDLNSKSGGAVIGVFSKQVKELNSLATKFLTLVTAIKATSTGMPSVAGASGGASNIMNWFGDVATGASSKLMSGKPNPSSFNGFNAGAPPSPSGPSSLLPEERSKQHPSGMPSMRMASLKSGAGMALRGGGEVMAGLAFASPSLGDITDYRLTKSQAAFNSFNLGGTLSQRRGAYENQLKESMRLGTYMSESDAWNTTKVLMDNGFRTGQMGYSNVLKSMDVITNMNPGIGGQQAAASYARMQQASNVNMLKSHGINLRDSKGGARSIESIAGDLSRRVDQAYAGRGGNINDRKAYSRDIQNSLLPGNALSRMMKNYFPDNPEMQETMTNMLLNRAQTGSLVSTKKQNEATGLTTSDVSSEAAKNAAKFKEITSSADNLADGLRKANGVLGTFHRLLGNINGSLIGKAIGFGKSLTGDAVGIGAIAGAYKGAKLLKAAGGLRGLMGLGSLFGEGVAAAAGGGGLAAAATAAAPVVAAVGAGALLYNKRKWLAKHPEIALALGPAAALSTVGNKIWDKVMGGDVNTNENQKNSLNMLKGLSPEAQQVEVAARSMGFNNIGGVGDRANNPNSDHPSGNALDIMVPLKSSKGTSAANYFVKNRAAYNVKYVIWDNKFAGPSTGWNWDDYAKHGPKSNQATPTGRHEDHVHISVNRGSATDITPTNAADPIDASAVENNTPSNKRQGLKNGPASLTTSGTIFNSSSSASYNKAAYGSYATSQVSMNASSTDNLSPYKAAIAGIESSGWSNPYVAKSKNSTASGKYQVTNKTWNNYEHYPTAMAAPPSVQEKFFENLFGSYLKKYGDKGAAVAWFQGPGVASGKSKAIVDANGTTTDVYIKRYMDTLAQFGQKTTPQKAKGDWNVAQDEFARIHQGEMVVPAKLAGAMREALEATKAGAHAVGQRSVVIQLTIKDASDQEALKFAKRVKKLLDNESDMLSIRSS